MAGGLAKEAPEPSGAARRSDYGRLAALYRPIGLKAVLAACSILPAEQEVVRQSNALAADITGYPMTMAAPDGNHD